MATFSFLELHMWEMLRVRNLSGSTRMLMIPTLEEV